MKQVIFVATLFVFLTLYLSAVACECGNLYPLPPSRTTKAVTKEGKADSSILLKAAKEADRKGKPDYLYDVPTPVVIHPERTIWVRISATDVNRIVCTSGKIEDVIFSEEKGVKIPFSENQAWLKLQAKLDPEKGTVEYSTIPVEVYVVCAGETYGFIGRPRKMPSRTIYLVSKKKDVDSGRNSLRATDVDKAVAEVLGHVIQDDIPSAWEPQRPWNVDPKAIKDLNLSPGRDWRIPGVGIRVRELEARSMKKNGQVVLSEEDFLLPGITVNPVAISIINPSLKPGEKTRVVILEKVTNEF